MLVALEPKDIKALELDCARTHIDMARAAAVSVIRLVGKTCKLLSSRDPPPSFAPRYSQYSSLLPARVSLQFAARIAVARSALQPVSV